MAVYTQVSAESLGDFLTRYDVGQPLSFKGIAEGVENSNYLVDTTRGRFILTLYEKRVDPADLPFFLGVMRHAADRGVPTARPVADRQGQALQQLSGKPACLIEFLPGVSVSEPTPVHCHAAGAALGRLHHALADFAPRRANSLALNAWHRLARDVHGRVDNALDSIVGEAMAALDGSWPDGLPQATIHADLFPDNVLMHGAEVTGLIDFYFACTDIRAYDLAVMHSAWCFSGDGRQYDRERAAALVAGYRSTHGLLDDEAAALPLLCRGAALRFTLTRAFDWIHTPADALVTRKDPHAFARRLTAYATIDARALGL